MEFCSGVPLTAERFGPVLKWKVRCHKALRRS